MKAQKYPASEPTLFQPDERIVTISTFAQKHNQSVYENFPNLFKLVFRVGLLLLFDNLLKSYLIVSHKVRLPINDILQLDMLNHVMSFILKLLHSSHCL